MTEPTVIKGVSGKDVGIALIEMDDDQYRYMDLSNNTVFTSDTDNRTHAYVQNREKMAAAKSDKKLVMRYDKKRLT